MVWTTPREIGCRIGVEGLRIIWTNLLDVYSWLRSKEFVLSWKACFSDFATAGLNVEILGAFISPWKNYQVNVLELEIWALLHSVNLEWQMMHTMFFCSSFWQAFNAQNLNNQVVRLWHVDA